MLKKDFKKARVHIHGGYEGAGVVDIYDTETGDNIARMDNTSLRKRSGA